MRYFFFQKEECLDREREREEKTILYLEQPYYNSLSFHLYALLVSSIFRFANGSVIYCSAAESEAQQGVRRAAAVPSQLTTCRWVFLSAHHTMLFAS